MNTLPMLTLEQLDKVLDFESPLRQLISDANGKSEAADHNGAFVILLDALRRAQQQFGDDHEYCVPLKIAVARADVQQCIANYSRGNNCSYARQLLDEVAASLPEPFKSFVEMVALCNYSVGIEYDANDRG